MAVCLKLISLSSLALEQTDDSYDLVFDLSSKPLPLFSAVECWRGRPISPLRDRTMIEWLCSHRTADSILKEMTSLIDKTLKLRTSSSSSRDNKQSEVSSSSTAATLQVAVACQNGAQHSVCFVEKLYEKYSFENPLMMEDGVKVDVKRRHIEATRGEWLSTKNAVWQHSKIAWKHLINRKDLILNRSWSSFPNDIAHQIEAAFFQDPFSTKVDVGKHIVDFERGMAYNKRSREEFRIRSAIPSLEGKVKSSWLQEKGKRQFFCFCGAGILFYSIHPRTGEAVFLLGHMTYSCMSWCDFGGMKNHGEESRYTAARECYEETLGVLGETNHLVSLLENSKENNVFQITNENTKYVGYYLRVPYSDYPAAFDKALKKKSGSKEVNEVRWFSLSCLRSGIQKALLDQYDLSVEPLKKDGSIAASQRLPLRSEFVWSLCIAEQLGVLNSIEHIAKTHYAARDQPPPPSHSPSGHTENHLHLATEGATTFPTGATNQAKLVTKVSTTNDCPPLRLRENSHLDELQLRADLGTERNAEERRTGVTAGEEVSKELEELSLSPSEQKDTKNETAAGSKTQLQEGASGATDKRSVNSTSRNSKLRLFGVGTGSFLN